MSFLTNINLHFYLASYLIGGIPFGYLIMRFFFKINLKEVGSGSIGATNVLRVLKESDPKKAKKIAILTAVLDGVKGVVLILIAKLVGLSVETQWSIAVLSVVGHCFSPYLKFEGGKGVATGFGVFTLLIPYAALVGFACWFIAGKVFKISSISSLFGLFGLLVASFIFYFDVPVIDSHAPIFIIAFFIFYKHIPNIVRFIHGEEKKVI